MFNSNTNQFTHHFQDCKTEAEVRKIYRMLAFKYHPDHGGNDAASQKKHHYRGDADFLGMAFKYGYTEVQPKEATKIAA